jgi:hypothetical protein
MTFPLSGAQRERRDDAQLSKNYAENLPVCFGGNHAAIPKALSGLHAVTTNAATTALMVDVPAILIRSSRAG